MKTRMGQGRNGLALVTAIGVAGFAGFALVVAPQVVGGAIGPRTERTVTRLELPLEPSMVLQIVNTGGRIAVSGWDGESAQVTITREVSPRGNAIERLFRKDPATNGAGEPVVRSNDEGVQVSTLGITTADGAGVNYHFDIKLPRGRGLAVSNGNGPITVADVEGDVTTISDNGDVRCETIVGRLSTRVRNGGVICSSVSGSIEVSAANGSIEVDATRDAPESVRVSAANGAITFHAPIAAMRLNATTDNGRIVCEGAAYGADTHQALRTLTTNGGEGAAEVELHALNGNIYVDAI